MNKYGYFKVAAAVPSVRVADCQYNAEHIVAMMRRAADRGVRVVVFPELSIGCIVWRSVASAYVALCRRAGFGGYSQGK